METCGMSRTVAFIGLGNMGLPMAVNLVKAGFDVMGYDSAGQMRAAAAEAGVRLADSQAGAVAGRDIVVAMLPNGAIVRTVMAEVALSARPGAVVIDCSTIDVESARWMHEHLSVHGFMPVDAPVSGGTKGARDGTLTFMCGGTEEAIALARPVLSTMGKRLVHCGPAASGQAAKICNNMILGVSMIAVGEAFNLADGLGLDRQAMFDVVSTSSGSCWSINQYCPVPGVGPDSPADHQYRPGFAAALMLKDLGLSQDAAQAAGVATPLGRHAKKLYENFISQGGGDRDFSAIIEALSTMRRE
jgi:3-hydroxyisobutyrate dehydrogenase